MTATSGSSPSGAMSGAVTEAAVIIATVPDPWAMRTRGAKRNGTRTAGRPNEANASGRGRPVGEPSLHRVAGGHAWKQSIDGEDEADDQSDNGVAEEGQRSDPGRRFVRIAGELPLGVLVDRGADGIGDDEQQRHDER